MQVKETGKSNERQRRTSNTAGAEQRPLEFSSSARQQHGATQHNLVYLTDGIFCNKERTQLFEEWQNSESGDSTFKPIRTRWGMPVLEHVYQEDTRDDDRIDDHTYYEIRLSNRPHQGVKRFTHHQIEFGKWAAAFGGISIAKNAQQKFYANVIFEQLDAFNIPLEMMPEHTGFQLIEGTGTYRYVLRTGEHLHSDGTITSGHAPLARYSFDSEGHTNHLTAWRQYEPLLPTATKELASDLFAWATRVDPSGNLLLLQMFAYRSLLSTIVPIETAIIAAAEDGTTITDGGSGSGKTSSIDFCRGGDGPTPYKAEQDAAFSGSLTGIETRINSLRDLLVSISDFHFNTENPSDSEVRGMADKFDAFIRSISDNGEVKSRGKRNVTAAQGTRIKAGLVFDGEMLPPLFLSRLRRAIVLQFKRGVVNTDQLHNDWWTCQGKHTAIARALIASVLTAINSNRNAFAQQFKEHEATKSAELFNALIGARPTFDKAIARSLANNYARCLSPLFLLKNALGLDSSEIETLTRQAIVRSMTAFANMIDNGGPSQISAEWMISTINAIFEEGQGYPLDMNNFPLAGEENALLNRWGYERTGLIEHPWAPPRHGIHIANLSDDKETLWFRNEQLLNLVKRRALKDFPTFPYSIQTFPAFLVRLSLAERNDKQNTWLERFGEKGEARERRIKVQGNTLSIEIEKESSDSSDSSDSTMSDGSTGGSSLSLLSVTASTSPNEAVTNDPARSYASVTASQEQKRAVTESSDKTIGSTGGSNGLVTAVTAVTALKTSFQEEGQTGYEPLIIDEQTEWLSQQYDAAFMLFAELEEAGQWLAFLPDGRREFVPLNGQRKLDKEERARFIERVKGIDPAVLLEAWESTHQLPEPEPEPPTSPTSPAQTRQHSARKETRVIYADINAGRAISLSGDTLPFTANRSLPELARQIVNDQDTRVFLCGELPVDYEAWLIDPAMFDIYSTGKRGHYLDPKDHTGHVARFEHRTTGSKLEIRSMSAWLGDSAYTVEQARDAVLLLNQYLQRAFTHDTIAYSTPSQTFQQIWTRQNRIEKKSYPLLPQNIRDIIHSTSGQGRVELLTQEHVKKLSELHYYDGVFMYAALTWGLPTELETHDHVGVYAGKVPARYRIKYTVPGDWDHIGLFMTPKGNETWIYPGNIHQGQTFETWADGAEIAALIDHYSPALTNGANATKEEIRDEKERAYRAGMLAAFSAWKIEISERIVFKAEKDSEHKKPLDTITKKLVAMREQLEKDACLDTSRSVVYKLVRGMVRNIVLHGIGAFHRNKRDLTIILPKDAPAPDNIIAAPKELGDNLYIYSVPGKVDAYSEQFDHPEYSALVWARCRARMTKWALSLPRESLIAIRTDAIATTQEVDAWRASEKVGTLREKWSIKKSLKAPHTYEELDTLVEKHVKEGR